MAPHTDSTIFSIESLNYLLHEYNALIEKTKGNCALTGLISLQMATFAGPRAYRFCCKLCQKSLLLYRCRDAAVCGYTSIKIRHVDTDVVVLAVSVAQELNIQLWICHGVGDRYLILSINDIALSLGTDKCKALPFFLALTGCDTVPSFHSKRKKSFWQAWT